MKALLLAGMLFGAASAYGQGCAQCQDNMRETPAKTQAAYRHAIALMVVGAGGVFAGGAWVTRRFR